jgi:hypothetical protein
MSEKGLDLGALDTRRYSEQGRELQLRHPGDGTPIEARVMVRGYDSDAYQRALDAQQQRRLERLPTHRVSVDDIRADALELSSALLAGWSNLAIDGQPFEYSPGNAVTLLRRFPWIREQVEGAAADRGKFLPASSTG